MIPLSTVYTDSRVAALVEMITLTQSDTASDADVTHFQRLENRITTDQAGHYFPKHSFEFKEALKHFKGIFHANQNESFPTWQLLAAFAIFNLYTHTLPKSGLPLNHRDIKQCIRWANIIVNLSDANTRLNNDLRIQVYEWLGHLYLDRGTRFAEKRKRRADSSQKLIALSLDYFEKIALINLYASDNYYAATSNALNKLIELSENLLPSRQHLKSSSLTRLINLYQRQINYFTDCKLEKSSSANKKISMAKLARLYATYPTAPGKEPDYQTAMYWLEKAVTENRHIISKIHKIIQTKEIITARHEAKKAFNIIVNRSYKKLCHITQHYLLRDNITAKKRDIFRELNHALVDISEDSTYQRIVAFKKVLDQCDKKIFNHHDTATWKRYLANIISVALIIPALIRIGINQYQYATCRFWQPESKKIIDRATTACEEALSVCKLGPSIFVHS